MNDFSFPPMLARIQVGGRLGFWLPLFLIWPFVAVLLLLLSPFLLIAYIVLWSMNRHEGIGAFFIAVYKVICAVRGLEVDVDGPHPRVKVIIK